MAIRKESEIKKETEKKRKPHFKEVGRGMQEQRELMEVIPETERCKFFNETQQRMCVSLVKIDRQDFQKEIGEKTTQALNM